MWVTLTHAEDCTLAEVRGSGWRRLELHVVMQSCTETVLLLDAALFRLRLTGVLRTTGEDDGDEEQQVQQGKGRWHEDGGAQYPFLRPVRGARLGARRAAARTHWPRLP